MTKKNYYYYYYYYFYYYYLPPMKVKWTTSLNMHYQS